MNLDDAAKKHAEWKLKFRTAINIKETMNAAMIRTDNNCDLGKWLHGEGRTRFGTKPTFQRLTAKHTEFHRAAGKVADAINAGQYDLAARMLENGTEYTQSSTAVGIAIIALKNEIA